MVIVDISHMGHPQFIGQRESSLPFNPIIAGQSALPLPGRKLALVDSKAIMEDCQEPLNHASNDGREYIFSLREGVKFHHGKELDRGDVKYSIDRVMDPATRAPRAFACRWVDSGYHRTLLNPAKNVVLEEGRYPSKLSVPVIIR